MTRRAVPTAMTLVTAGSMTANLAGYFLHLPASRWLGLSGYGEFASLLAVQLLLAVPALAVQTVAARELVLGASTADVRRVVRRAAMLSVGVAAVLTPLVAAVLHVSVVAAAVALTAAPILVLLSGEQGILQGTQQFTRLGAVLGLTGIAKVTPAVAVLACGGGPAATLAAATAGTAAAAMVAHRLTVSGRVGAVVIQRDAPVPISSVLSASQVQLVLIGLTSVDLLAAQIMLSGPDASRYALGAVATKAAFWLPQAVGVVLYPQMADPVQAAAAVRTTLRVLTGLGAVVVAGVAVAAPLAPILAGAGYAPITGYLWLFALDGALLAILQGALLAAIAAHHTRLAAVAWLGLTVSVTTLLTVGTTIDRILAIAVTMAAVTTAGQVLAHRASLVMGIAGGEGPPQGGPDMGGGSPGPPGR